MIGQISREDRSQTRLSVRLNFDGRWQDGTIRNVSPKGVMVQCAQPPCRGTFIEMRRGANIVVAQVRWTGDGQFGALSQTRLDLGRLKDVSHRRAPEFSERRSARRIEAVRAPGVQERAEASARLARLIDYSFVVVAVVAGALLVAQTIADVFSEPLLAASAAMRGTG